jgi:hypothetical protein
MLMDHDVLGIGTGHRSGDYRRTNLPAAESGDVTELKGGSPWPKNRLWRENDHPEHQWA